MRRRNCIVSKALAATIALMAFVSGLGTISTVARADRPIAVISTSVPLNPRNPDQILAGKLLFRGAIAIRSSDSRFGGLSGLFVSPDGKRLIAISDRGSRFTANLRYDAEGNIAGLSQARIGALLGTDGRPLRGRNADAEALTFLPDGSALVAFERRHRIYRYPASRIPLSGRPVLWSRPVGLSEAPDNGGIEALTHVGRRFLFALTEKLRANGRNLAGWVGRDRNWEPFSYVRKPGYRPTDATLMPNGDVAVLERKYTMSKGSSVRVVVVPRRMIAPGRALKGREILHLKAPMTVDNFEGIAARRGRDRRVILYLISDDNFNPLQRTLLMMFETP